MAVFHPHTVRCLCGTELPVLLADSINIKRSPALREKILRRELHHASCPGCRRTMSVEKPFYYTDLERHGLFKVLPRWERHLWKDEAAKLNRAVAQLPGMMKPDDLTLRVVFGMDELREKLVGEDAGLDDRFVELLKILLIYEHPILIQRTRLRIVLTKVSDEALEFRASYEHHPQRFRLRIPRDLVEGMVDRRDALQSWVTKGIPHQTLFETGATWVNVWRFSPQPAALRQLQEYAAQLEAGKAIDPSSTEFKRMLRALPRGKHLPRPAKKHLAVLWAFARKKKLESLKESLFELRFGVDLEDDWSRNEKRNDIDTIWRVLDELPETHIEGNTELEEIQLLEGEEGGWYDGDEEAIGIGADEIENPEWFENVLLHEVGHAVHEDRSALVEKWLAERFGWQIFRDTTAGIDQWVTQMGGWGDLTTRQRQEVRGFLKKALGKDPSWNHGPAPVAPKDHPWRRKDFGPRLAYEQSGSHWYKNYMQWHRANGKAFFLNFYYKTFLVVDEEALDLVEKMPDPYATMSHFEYFAEIYAVYYDRDHPMRKNLPKDVTAWLEKNLGRQEPARESPRRRSPSPSDQALKAMTAFRRA